MNTSVTRKSFLAGLGMLAASGLAPRVARADDGGWSLGSATWQDPENIMVMWSPQGGAGTSYEVYRASQGNLDFELVGTTSETSFRDGDAAWPESPTYRVCAVTTGVRSWSSPMAWAAENGVLMGGAQRVLPRERGSDQPAG